MTGRGVLLGAVVAAGVAKPAAACRQALVLALDVSGSVDAAEYRQQLGGLAAALEDPAVLAAIVAAREPPLAVAVFEWSGARYQRVIQDWVLLASPAEVAALAARLRGWARGPAPEATGVGAALARAAALLASAPPCARQTIDVSGDGRNNDWPAPRQVRAGGALDGVTVNGLVVHGAEAPEALAAWFRAEVASGPLAFVEEAQGYGDYAAAMRRKLLRETAGPPVAAVARPQAGARGRGQLTIVPE